LTLALKHAEVQHENLKGYYEDDTDEEDDDSDCSDSGWDELHAFRPGNARPRTGNQNSADRAGEDGRCHSTTSNMTMEKLDNEMYLVLQSLDFFRSQVTALKDSIQRSERENLSYIEVKGLKAACSGPTHSLGNFVQVLGRFENRPFFRRPMVPSTQFNARRASRPITLPARPTPTIDDFAQLATKLDQMSNAKQVPHVSQGEQNLNEVEGLLKKWTDVFEVNDKDAFEIVGKEEHK
jgi:hypothetical protein